MIALSWFAKPIKSLAGSGEKPCDHKLKRVPMKFNYGIDGELTYSKATTRSSALVSSPIKSTTLGGV